MRAAVVMVAAWWLATATAWAAAPAVGHAAHATHGVHGAHAVHAGKAQTSAHRKGAKQSATASHGGRTGRSAKSAHASHPKHETQHISRTPRQASAHKPVKPAAVRPASHHRLMVDAPAPSSVTPSVPVKRAIQQPHELPPILS
ncbi:MULTISPECIES: hypothetical protein [unclassified Paraburkholderia]|uniref:hypothetical protein n=1 Tax=unclassified Paraburkholderia TaxID=2615204 RepID=UPI002AB31131|nr:MULTISPECIES: hypothetical protein [unclassified Paraburkholderia]